MRRPDPLYFPRPKEIAAQIYKNISEDQPDLLRRYDPDFFDSTKPYDTCNIPQEGHPEPYSDMFAAQGVQFTKGRKKTGFIETRHAAQSDLISLLVNSGVRGLVRIPLTEDDCRSLLREYERFIQNRNTRIWQLIEERTTDEDLQQKIYDALRSLLHS